jgi:penicillin-binding protein 1A
MARRPLLTALLLATLLVASSCASLVEQFEDLPRLTDADLNFNLAQSSIIYDAKGRQLTTLHGEQNRNIIALGAMPKQLQQAVVAIEDERFYHHDGVDVRAILRAAVSNVASGSVTQGGSTITQQYVKNVIISPNEIAERSLERKIDEAALSRQLERRLSKREILRRYLNTVYFGNGAYGVEAAAHTYFGKSATRLNLRESATLAGIIRSPNNYNPIDHPRTALQRRNLVLDKMRQLGWATATKVHKATRQKLRLRPGASEARYPAPYFIDYVKRLITFHPAFKKLGKTTAQRTQQLFRGGLRIRTTLDMNMQQAAEAAVNSTLTSANDPHASLVAVDPLTGDVKAMVGGRDWFAPKRKNRFSKLNLAIASEPGLGCKRIGKKCDRRAPGTGRQAGSAFKPFTLAAAIADGVPLSKIYEAKGCASFPGANADGSSWEPCNYEGGTFGRISLLEATAKSVNVIFARLMLEGATKDDDGQADRKRTDWSVCSLCERTVEVAHAMGINTDLQAVPSTVLGANPVNPLGMASAYGTLATNGVRRPPVAITEITNSRGKVLYRAKREQEEALEPAVAYLTTTALETVIQRGTGVRAQIGRPAAGKTGTAQDYRDAWFTGYTPNLAAAVWVGYPEGSVAMKTSCAGTSNCKPTRIQVTGGSWPTEIWQKFMKRAVAGLPAAGFKQPASGFERVVIDTRDGCLADRFTPAEYRENATFAAGTAPEETCRENEQIARVPDVMQFPVQDAKRILEDDGFNVDVVEQRTSEFPPGRVIDQSPGGGRRAKLGSTVTLTVSRAKTQPNRGTVPDVLGMRRADAARVIRNEGFEVRVVERKEAKTVPSGRRGRVWKQDPSGGSKAPYGSTVNIWVNPS